MAVEEQILGIIEDVVGIKPKLSDSFDDLEMDELDKIDVILKVEDEYAISIPDDDANALVSVSGLVTYVENEIR